MKSSFDELLNAYWLRPETALWRELDIRAMHGFEFKSPSLDIGCGDGLFSFIRAGGRMSADFDAFKYLANLDKFYENADVFDAFMGEGPNKVITTPSYKIDMGFDHKENLLKKSQMLGLYIRTKQGDANARLPFEDNSFNSIFSNVVYWLEDIPSVMAEIARILQPGGRVCLMLPNKTLPEYSFYNQLYVKTGNPKWEFLQKIDRGRFADNIRHARPAAEWEEIFKRVGLKIHSHKRHLSKVTIQIWDIGFRPLFPLLKKITDKIDPQEIVDIKAEWIDTLKMFLEPLLDIDADNIEGFEPAFHCYILEK